MSEERNNVFDPFITPYFLQYTPMVYKMARRNGINTYQMSVLFTMLNVDVLNAGVRLSDIVHHNAMDRDAVRSNLVQLENMECVTQTGSDRQRYYFITQIGRDKCRAILERMNSYKGEAIYTTDVTGTYIERSQRQRAKRAVKLAANPSLLNEAIKIREANTAKQTGNDAE